jgi:hypothetical protein
VEQDPSPQIGLSLDEANPEVTEPILLEPLLETFLHCNTPPAASRENSVLHAHSAGLRDDLSAHLGAGGSVAPALAEQIKAPLRVYYCNIPDVTKQLKLDHEASSSINIK